MLFSFDLRDLALVRLALKFCQQQIRRSHIIRNRRTYGKTPTNWQAIFSSEICDGIFIASEQPLDEEQKELQAFLHRSRGGAGLNNQDMPADLFGSRIVFVHSRDGGYVPVVAHPTANLGTGHAVSAGIEGRAGEK